MAKPSGRGKLKPRLEKPDTGKLCSNPFITNADLYLAFYQAGYTPAEITYIFGRRYEIVWQAIMRKINPKYAQMHKKHHLLSRGRHGFVERRTKEARARQWQERKVRNQLRIDMKPQEDRP